ncbi:MAG: hypothetical protein ABIW76_09350, partial [Fibrobacteria bacterium]
GKPGALGSDHPLAVGPLLSIRYPLAFDAGHLGKVLRLFTGGPEPKGYLCAQDAAFNLLPSCPWTVFVWVCLKRK